MEDNVWKIIFIATIFSIITLIGAYFLISGKTSYLTGEEDQEKLAEFKDTRVAGRKDGKPAWDFFAKEGYTTKNSRITYLFNVTKGNIYKDNATAVMGLTAPQVKTFEKTKDIEASGGKQPINARIDLKKISSTEGYKKNEKEMINMTADSLKYNPDESKSLLSGNIRMVKKDATIYSDTMDIDHENKTADIKGNINIVRKDLKMTSSKILYFGDEEKLNCQEKVAMDISEKDKSKVIKTHIESDQADIFADSKKDAQIKGDIKVAQKKKLATAGEGVYSKTDRQLILSEDVKVIIEKAQAALKPETVEKLKNPDAREILKDKTILTADKVVISTKTGDADAFGKVVVTQKGREAKANEAHYDDVSEMLTLTGNVFMKREKSWIKCNKVVVDIQKETFEAYGQVESEFKLEK